LKCVIRPVLEKRVHHSTVCARASQTRGRLLAIWILALMLLGVLVRKGVFGGEEEGGGVLSGQGEAGTILVLHIISARPSKQPLLVRTFLKVYLELGSYFVSARTNKRYHHHLSFHSPGCVPCHHASLVSLSRATMNPAIRLSWVTKYVGLWSGQKRHKDLKWVEDQTSAGEGYRVQQSPAQHSGMTDSGRQGSCIHICDYSFPVGCLLALDSVCLRTQ
jgi:hypothetical protein